MKTNPINNKASSQTEKT